MEVPEPGLLGTEHCSSGLQDRIFVNSPGEGTFEGYSNPTGSFSKTGTRRRNPWPLGKKSNLRGRSFTISQPDPVYLFPNSEEAEPVETHIESQAYQQDVHNNQEVQDGNSFVHHPVSVSGHVGHYDRSQGRLSSHTNPSRLPQVSSLPVSERRLLLQGPSVWSRYRPEGVHQSLQGGRRSPQKKRDPAFCIPRRLAHSRKLRVSGTNQHRSRATVPPRVRLGCQLGEVLSNSKAVHNVPRGSSGLALRYGLSDQRKGSNLSLCSQRPDDHEVSSCEVLASSTRPDGLHGGYSSHVPPPYETCPVLCPEEVQTSLPPFVMENPSGTGDSTFPAMVDHLRSPSSGSSVHPVQTTHLNHHRRFVFRVGSSVECRVCGRSVEQLRKTTPHECFGAESGLQRSEVMGRLSLRSRGHRHLRQLHHRGIHKPPGRNEIPQPLYPHMGSADLLSRQGHCPQGQPPGGETQCFGGCPVQRQAGPERMGVSSTVGRPHLQPVRSPVRRPLCISRQPQTSDFLHQVPSSNGLGSGRSFTRLGRPVDIRLPPSPAHLQNSNQVPSVEGGHASSGSVLAETAVVSTTSTASGGSTIQISSRSETPISEEGPGLPPRPAGAPIDCVEIVNNRLQKRGLSKKTAEFAALARRPSTTRTYNSRLAKFTQWADDNAVSPLDASLEEVCSFLVHLFDSGRQVSTIRNYRSALAAVHNGFQDGSSISNNEAISDLLKGMFNRRPPPRKLSPTWSINEVLQSLTKSPFEPLQNSPLDALTLKTLFLLAAASARRRSELHALSVKQGFIRFTPSGVHLLPDPEFLSKNQSILFTPEPIFLPNLSEASSIREDRFVCPVRALKWYLEKTKRLRTSDALFILPRAPYSPASKDTISRWIVNLVAKHAHPDDPVRAHDVRAHASSVAWFKGVPLADIMKAAAWKTPSSFVSAYLTNIVSPEGSFATTVLRGSTSVARDLPPTSRC